MKRMRKALPLALVLVVLTAGCGVETLKPTNVTSNSATLRAQVQCSYNAKGIVWWELRAPGAAWKAVGAKTTYYCGAKKKVIPLSQNVTGLQAGTTYQYRLVADPVPAGGAVVRTAAAHLATLGATGSFTPGVVASADHAKSAFAAKALGAHTVRVEFDIATPVSQMRTSIDQLARAGARPVLLAGFEGRLPTPAEAQNLANWAAEFGPGGRFWAGRSDGRLAARDIEFGNETSYGYQYGDNYAAASYAERAENYARRFADARRAIAMTGRPVGLLAQADDGGSGSANWVNHMFRAVPNLASMVGGWTVHPYGPRDRWKPKLDRLVMQTAANGAPASIPIDVTEYGISSDNGAALSDNYGWARNATYDQAAMQLESAASGMRSDANVGKRLRLFMVYAAHDLGTPRSSYDRERYFGALQANLAAKGAYTTEVRRLLSR
jgi:hypothetical protein